MRNTCGLWLLACAFGTASTYIADLYQPALLQTRYYGLMVFAGFLCVFFKIKKRRILCRVALTLSGFYWGLCHCAGDGTAARGQNVRIISQDNFSFEARRVVVQSNTHQVYRAISRLPEGQQGRLTCHLDHCFVMPSSRAYVAELSPLERAQVQFRSAVFSSLEHLGHFERSWFALLLLGDTKGMDPQTLSAFKIAGLFHFLVISGFHICILGDALLWFCALLLRPFYLTRLIKPPLFVTLTQTCNVVVAVACFCFAVAVGMSAASQRASLSFIAVQCFRILCPCMNFWARVALTACIQNLVFPLSFFSAGNVMSWCGYLTFSSHTQGVAGRLWLKQSVMFCLTAFLFRQWTPLGLILNPILSEYFNLVVVGTVLALLLSNIAPWLGHAAAYLGSEFITCVELWSVSFPVHEWLETAFPLGSTSTRVVLMAISVILLYKLASGRSMVRIDSKLEDGETDGTMEEQKNTHRR